MQTNSTDSTERLPHDPTPEQIAEICAEIRSRWTPLEWKRRAASMLTEPVEVAEIEYDDELPAEW